jgi:hypothetical protein
MSPRKAKASADPATEVKPSLPIASSQNTVPTPSVPKVPAIPAIPADGDFVVGSKWDQIRQTNAYEGSCWIYAPARVEFLAEASGALVTVAELLKMTTERITKIEVVLQRSTKRLFFRPAKEDATSYFDAAETSNEYLSVNIRSLLQTNGLEVKKGYQERYPVSLQVDSPVGPALMVDLTKVEERRQTAARKATKAGKVKGTGESSLTATSTKTKGSPAPSKGKAASKKAAAPAPEVPAEPVAEEDADLLEAEVDELDLNEE